MRFVPYDELGDTPNIVVDGAGRPSTRLVLSHWPKSGTPDELKADVSAEIVFNYLDRPEFREDVDAVSNNHFDEDGLIGVYALLHPDAARKKRALLIDAAEAGDFGTYRSREAARIAFTISAMAQGEASPYEALLPKLAEIVEDVDRFRPFWAREDERLSESEEAIRSGRVTIEEHPALDLAIVRGDAVPMAVHQATRCFRILRVVGRTYELQYRYESWVQYISARPLPRVDLAPLAQALSEEEGARWEFDGIGEITPRLHLGRESRIPADRFVSRVKSFLNS